MKADKQTPINLRSWQSWLVIILLVTALILILYFYYPVGVDWEETFGQTATHLRDPYEINTFTNPPWVVFLLPHAWLPIKLGNAVNFALNLVLITAVVHKFGGDWKTLLLVFTSPPFFDLARTNNIEWIPLLATLLPPAWGLPVLVLKPHAIGGAALVWWKKEKHAIKMLIPLAAVVASSFLIWGFWPLKFGLVTDSDKWNFAPWPLGIPLGVYMLYRAYKSDDQFLAAAATPFLVPYIAPYSITAVLAYIGSKYRRAAFFVYVGFWVYFVVETRRVAQVY